MTNCTASYDDGPCYCIACMSPAAPVPSAPVARIRRAATCPCCGGRPGSDPDGCEGCWNVRMSHVAKRAVSR